MKPSKAQKQPATPPESTLEGLDALISTLSVRLKAALDDEDTSLKQTVNLATEIRKLEALKMKQAAQLTMPMVVQWLRQQSDEDRAKVLREFSNATRRTGVLG